MQKHLHLFSREQICVKSLTHIVRPLCNHSNPCRAAGHYIKHQLYMLEPAWTEDAKVNSYLTEQPTLMWHQNKAVDDFFSKQHVVLLQLE